MSFNNNDIKNELFSKNFSFKDTFEKEDLKELLKNLLNQRLTKLELSSSEQISSLNHTAKNFKDFNKSIQHLFKLLEESEANKEKEKANQKHTLKKSNTKLKLFNKKNENSIRPRSNTMGLYKTQQLKRQATTINLSKNLLSSRILDEKKSTKQKQNRLSREFDNNKSMYIKETPHTLRKTSSFIEKNGILKSQKTEKKTKNIIKNKKMKTNQKNEVNNIQKHKNEHERYLTEHENLNSAKYTLTGSSMKKTNNKSKKSDIKNKKQVVFDLQNNKVKLFKNNNSNNNNNNTEDELNKTMNLEINKDIEKMSFKTSLSTKKMNIKNNTKFSDIKDIVKLVDNVNQNINKLIDANDKLNSNKSFVMTSSEFNRQRTYSMRNHKSMANLLSNQNKEGLVNKETLFKKNKDIPDNNIFNSHNDNNLKQNKDEEFSLETELRENISEFLNKYKLDIDENNVDNKNKNENIIEENIDNEIKSNIEKNNINNVDYSIENNKIENKDESNITNKDDNKIFEDNENNIKDNKNINNENKIVKKNLENEFDKENENNNIENEITNNLENKNDYNIINELENKIENNNVEINDNKDKDDDNKIKKNKIEIIKEKFENINEYNSDINIENKIKNNKNENNDNNIIENKKEKNYEIKDQKSLNENERIKNFNVIDSFKKNNKILNNILKYLKEYEKIIFTSCNKYLNKKRISILDDKKEELLKILDLSKNEKMEEKINKIKKEFSEDELYGLPTPFSISEEASNKLIELNNKENIEIFKNYQDKNNKEINMLKIIYKILFILIGEEEIYSISSEDIFWKKCCNYLIEKSEGKIGDFILQKIPNFKFGSKYINEIETIIQENKSNIINELSSNNNLIFPLIKEALEYCGVIFVPKKTQGSIIIKNLRNNQMIINYLNKLKLTYFLANYEVEDED